MKAEMQRGETVKTRLKIDATMVDGFAAYSGDRNPIHLDLREANAYGYPRRVAHGAILTSVLSKVIGTQLPGPGAVWLSHSVEWLTPIYVEDEVDLVVTLEEVSDAASVARLRLTVLKADGKVAARGEAKVKLATKLAGKGNGSATGPRVALITGGSRGIGAAIAKRLGQGGMRVAIVYRGLHDRAQEIVEDIRRSGSQARAFAVDVTDQANWSGVLDEVLRTFGRVDVAVHGASPPLKVTPVSGLKYDDVELYLRTYVGGAVTLLQALSPGMSERKFGRFIFIGTGALEGTVGPGLGSYLVAKQALWGLVRSMATELGPLGITTNMVSPGMTVTDLSAEISIRVKEVEARRSPMRRLAMPEDTAEVVAFLAGDAAGYVNGSNLPVTGGAS